MTNNNALSEEQHLFKIMLTEFIKHDESMIYSSKVFWGIVRICYENFDRLEKRKDD